MVAFEIDLSDPKVFEVRNDFSRSNHSRLTAATDKDALDEERMLSIILSTSICRWKLRRIIEMAKFWKAAKRI